MKTPSLPALACWSLLVAVPAFAMPIPATLTTGASTAWYVLGTTLLFVKLKGRKRAVEVRAYNQPVPALLLPSRQPRKR